MSAIYLASRYSRYWQMKSLAIELTQHGHTVTSRWCTSEPLYDNTDARVIGQGEGLACAQKDLEDIRDCDTLVAIAEPMRAPSRGGRHVELGIAMGLKKRIVLVGKPENVFHLLPGIYQLRNIYDLLYFLEEAPKTPEVMFGTNLNAFEINNERVEFWGDLKR